MAVLVGLSAPAVSQGDVAVTDIVRSYLADAGYDLNSTAVVPVHDPSIPSLGASSRTGAFGLVKLNFTHLEEEIQQYLREFGVQRSIDDPRTIGTMLFIAFHEMEHLDCCHSGTGEPGNPGGYEDEECDELLAHINGTEAACGYVQSVLNNGGPSSDEEGEMLHQLCAHIQDDTNKLNGKKNKIAECATRSNDPNGSYDPCRCNSTSWPPDHPNHGSPCGSCPAFPPPTTGEDPYPGGVVAHCEACDHI